MCERCRIHSNFDLNRLIGRHGVDRFCSRCGEPLFEPEPLTLEELAEEIPYYLNIFGSTHRDKGGWAMLLMGEI